MTVYVEGKLFFTISLHRVQFITMFVCIVETINLLSL